MPEGLKNVLDRITQLWTGLDNTKKLAIGGVLAAVVIAFIAMAGYSSKPSKELLYDNLSATDYASISKALEAMGVEYSGSGTSAIYVDGHRRQEIVTKLAQENLIPAGVEGWEIFNMSRWDETSFDKDVKLHRAIKGSLEKMLMTLEYVKSARVELAIPKRNNFLTDTDPVKASVILSLKPGMESITRKQVMGVKNLIYRSIPGLTRENITITDQNGKEFVEPDEIDEAQRKLDLVDRKKAFEEKERRKWYDEIKTSLNEFYQADRVSIVRVALDMNWDEVTEKQHLVTPVEESPENPDTPYPDRKIMPGGTLTLSQNARKENFKGNGFTPGGPTGTEQQLPPGYRDLDYQRSEYGNQDVIQNNDYNRIEREVTRQPWEERSRSIAVMVDGSWVRTGYKPDGSGWERKYTAPSEEELRTLEKLLKASMLYKGSRGDQIVVAHLQKDRTAEFAEEDNEIRQKLLMQRLLIVSVIAVVALFLIYMLYRAIRREISRRRRMREEELAAQQQLMREAALRVADEGAAEVELSVDERARREMLENAMNLAREKPDQVAKLLRTWLSQDE
ncbi:MAG: flagellar M-ring protein FliF [Leptospirales bacterium]|nr:flagellar M-ring protein FliF [Leptospirales bacterium]HMZ37599.1 flagellar basal-body MS-ring/collar protein FliF [Leptospiraceae bacterium]HNE24496.1 flagellar basal-body MS-ring/collar protein FliF [Leptospiraceae bacterium]HNN60973.1 flagellar basal-body MS-ring/collar protein FliF [Leptospiraceae bacterium]HNN76859.1 flagellar basal-body MS-ring/collar protein FliF [Leptospiraceae bacterium]